MSRETADRRRKEKARARDRAKDRIKGAAVLSRSAGAAHDCSLRLYCPSESPSVAMLRALLLPHDDEGAAGFLDKFLRTRRCGGGERGNFLPPRAHFRATFRASETAACLSNLSHLTPFLPRARHSRILFLIVGLGAEEAAASSEREESPGDQRRRRAPMPKAQQRRRRRARPRRRPSPPKRPESSSALGGRGRSHAPGSGVQAHFS